MSLATLDIGQDAPKNINVVIEIPKGSHNKYEYDEKLGVIKLDRVLHSAVFYPCDYGFIPQTRSEDGDHLDVLVVISESVFPGCVVAVRPIGVLDMEDEKGRDYKIIAVSQNDPKLANINDINDLDVHFKKEIVHFFTVYKELEEKWVKVSDWKDKNEAYTIIQQAILRNNSL